MGGARCCELPLFTLALELTPSRLVTTPFPNLPAYLSDQIERVQKIVLRILSPEVSYSKALEDADLKTLFHRREELCSSLLKQIVESDQHKIAGLLPVPNDSVEVLIHCWNGNHMVHFRNVATNSNCILLEL